MKLKLSHILICLIAIIGIQCASSPEISEWRGPNRDGIYPDTNLLKEWPENGPELLWKYKELGMGYSSPVIMSDKIYITGTIDTVSYLFTFDQDGNLLWKKSYGRDWTDTYPGARPTPTIVGNKGYVLSGLGVLYCFSSENGEIIWQKDMFTEYDGRNIQHGIMENLIVDGDKLYVTPGGEDANVIALNRHNGDLIWKSKGNGKKSAYCTPLLVEQGGNKYYITMTVKTLMAINVENGEMAWHYELLNHYAVHANTPIYRDGYLFVINGWKAGCVMLKLSDDGKTYEEIWKSSLLDDTSGHAVLVGDNLYGAGETSMHLHCLDWFTGEEKYSSKMFAPGTTIYADGLLYCYTYDGDFGLIEPKDTNFELKSSFKIPGKMHFSHPVINDGRLFIRNHNNLWVYDISDS